MKLSLNALLFSFCAMFTLGCVEAGSKADAKDPSLCAAVSDHLSTCMAMSMPVDPHCDVTAAEEVLAQTCEEIDASGKADWFGDFLCRLGFLYRCEAPTCEAASDLGEVDDCSAYIDMAGCASCEYYACRDARRAEPCGEQGYYVGFAGRYCTLFTESTVPRLSKWGAEWIDTVRPCLQRAMETASDDLSCSDVKTHGYKAHPSCYIDWGFCELPLTDMITIFNTVSPMDVGTMPITTGFECLQRWFDPTTRRLTAEGQERVETEREVLETAR